MEAIQMETGIQLLGRLGFCRKIHTLDPIIFPDGFTHGQIIEICGDAGSGKTELLYRFVTRCILPSDWLGVPLPGLDVGVIFIDTDYHLYLGRLAAIMEYRIRVAFRHHPSVDMPSVDTVQQFIQDRLKNLKIVHCHTVKQLIATMYYVQNLLVNQCKLSLLIVDSLSAFYWTERANARTQLEFYTLWRQLASILRILSRDLKLLIMLTKQALTRSSTSEVSELTEANPYDYSCLGRDIDALFNARLILVYRRTDNMRTMEVRNNNVVMNQSPYLICQEGGFTISVKEENNL